MPRIPGSILCPVSALQQYLSCHPGSPGDPLFMLLDRKGSVKPDTSRTATTFLKEYINFIGLDRSGFCIHSFRRVGALFAFRAGAPAQFIKAQGDWASDAYF